MAAGGATGNSAGVRRHVPRESGTGFRDHFQFEFSPSIAGSLFGALDYLTFIPPMDASSKPCQASCRISW